MTDKEVIKLSQELITIFKCDSKIMVDYCSTVIEKFEQHPNTIQEEHAKRSDNNEKR